VIEVPDYGQSKQIWWLERTLGNVSKDRSCEPLKVAHTRAVAPTSRENIGWWNFETSPVTRRLDMVPNVLMAKVGEALDVVYSILPWRKSEGDGGS